ncbi:MAG TPA: DUF2933 domain-containing protein [Gammaproteobacteria bacterium]|nr:DUF2933 domain-containing protein [Gammaproteobacteria bacterium]
MEWLTQNWYWVLIGIAFVALHLFGHGGHGGHSKPIEPGKHTS